MADKILIVEADVILGEILTKKFTAVGYEVVRAKDFKEAQKAAKKILPRVALINLELGEKKDLTGFLKILISAPEAGRPILVALSQRGSREALLNAQKRGF